ncbi:hypothetical protein H4582DRAFT_2069319 [Lactarius indigo]|nr:hypothetical protein H4582DRAFT_2069319 [Lactarius indigo]
MTAVTSFFVQGYFCYRIWKLNKQLLWLCWIIAIFTVTQSTGAIWGAITSLTGRNFGVSKAPLYLWSIMSATADILIAVAMTLLLRRARGKFSNFVLIRVVRLTIETNALTASVAVASLVLYAAFPNEVYFAFTLDFIGKLYSNTLLVSLNNRIYLRDRLSSENRDGVAPTVSDRVGTTEVVTLTRFSGAEPRSRTSTSSDTSRPLELDKGHGDDLVPNIPGTDNFSPPSCRSSFLNGSVSLFSYSLENASLVNRRFRVY